MHSTDDLDDGYFGSGKRITRSIKKHGIGRHTKQILEHLPSRKALKLREKEMITDELRADPMCMNIAPGGGGGFKNEKHQRACASAGGKTGAGGKVGGLVVGHSLSRRCSDAGTLFTRGMAGKCHQESTKSKMSIAQTAEKNSQFGTCWVSNHQHTKKIPKTQIQTYLDRGYHRGRKRALVV